MEYKNFYSQVANPLDDCETIKKIIEIYGKKDAYLSYDDVMVQRENSIETWNEDYYKVLIEFLFNKWKNNVLNISIKKDIDPNNQMAREIIELQNLLKAAPDVKKRYDLVKYGRSNERIGYLLKKYFYDFEGEWIELTSRSIESYTERIEKTEHRFYLNIPLEHLHCVTLLLIKKFESRKIPYHFKIVDSASGRMDSLVLYSNSENLLKNLEVLRELKIECPHIPFKSPPVLTGKIDGWIGYGSEPTLVSTEGRKSFNMLRVDIVRNSIGEGIKDLIKRKANEKSLKTNSTVKEQFLRVCASCFVNCYKEEMKILKKSLEDTKKTIAEKLKPYFEHIMEQNFSNNMLMSISVNGKVLPFGGGILKKAIGIFALTLSDNPGFINFIRERIVNDSAIMGIDPNNFSFDIEILRKMCEIDSGIEF